GRAWAAIRANETVAEALGIGVASYKLLAFVISSALTAVAGALFAYYRGFVSVEVFSIFLSIQYVAMIIMCCMCSQLCAILRAISGFHVIDDAKVTEGTVIFKGRRIENGQPHANTRLGITLVPEREKVFPNLTVAENLLVPVAARVSRAEQHRREAQVYRF